MSLICFILSDREKKKLINHCQQREKKELRIKLNWESGKKFQSLKNWKNISDNVFVLVQKNKWNKNHKICS